MTIQELKDLLRNKLIGQDHAIERITPYVTRALAGITDEDRPCGMFFLMGPTGSGKTKTPEALAEVLHGSPRNLIRIDCGEFQLEHEVAKLIGCFTPGTTVLMGDGSLKPIQNIAVDDFVITKNGEQRAVLDLHTYEHTGEMVRIEFANSNLPLNATPGHKILAIKNTVEAGKRIRDPKQLYDPTKLEWVHAEDLQKNDILVYPRFKGVDAAPLELDLSEFAKDLPKHDWDDEWIWNGVGPKIRRFLKIDENFARLAGYYVSEGGNSKTRKNINFTLGVPQKQTAIDDITTLLPLVFGEECVPRIEDRTERGSVRIYLHSRIVSVVMAALFSDHTYTKQLPKFFLNLPDSLIWNFLDAAIMGDGGRTVRRRVQYDTVSETLYSQITLLLRRLGFITQTQLRSTKRLNWKPAYRIYIAGDQIERFAQGLPKAGAGINLDGASRKGIQRMAHVDDKYIYMRVTDVSRFDYKGPVYDISVYDQTSYVANGVTVSNSPPGYLGHRETQPILTQQKLNSMTTEKHNLAIVVFDEIEKAAAGLWRILLGILDKGRLTLGDNSVVRFDQTLIFMTSNLAAAEIMAKLSSGWGYTQQERKELSESELKALDSLGVGALAKKFPAEFPNRIDEVITFVPLGEEEYKQITRLELDKLQDRLANKLPNRKLFINYSDAVVKLISTVGTNIRYGARELKRTIIRHILNPIADELISGTIVDGSSVQLDVENNKIVWKSTAPVLINRSSEESTEVTTPKPESTKKPRKSQKTHPMLKKMDINDPMYNQWYKKIDDKGPKASE